MKKYHFWIIVVLSYNTILCLISIYAMQPFRFPLYENGMSYCHFQYSFDFWGWHSIQPITMGCLILSKLKFFFFCKIKRQAIDFLKPNNDDHRCQDSGHKNQGYALFDHLFLISLTPFLKFYAMGSLKLTHPPCSVLQLLDGFVP